MRESFSDAWAGEADRATPNTPISNFIATQDGALIGFACYDATALGFFGPIGVLESCRGNKTGKALLLACLLDMKWKGYGYAVIGSAGPAELYSKNAGAIAILDSTPGLWRTWLRRN